MGLQVGFSRASDHFLHKSGGIAHQLKAWLAGTLSHAQGRRDLARR